MAKGKKTGGRIKGVSVNKATKSMKERFTEAFNKLQDHDTANLNNWAENNPTEFYRLASKLIPTKVEADIVQPIQHIIQIIPDPNSHPIAD